MKKVIAILAVLVLVAGFAFADGETTTTTTHSEQHSIKIKADVTEVLPAFQMKVSAGSGSAAVESGLTNTGKAVFYKTTAGAYTPASNDGLDVTFNLDENGSVVATVYVANLAKTTKSFALEFGGGVFDVKIDKADAEHAPKTITTEAGTKVTGIKDITLGNAATSGNPESGTATNKIVNVVFNGTKMTAENAAVASATYAYEGNSKIDPTKENEYYFADVTMTVSSNY